MAVDTVHFLNSEYIAARKMLLSLYKIFLSSLEYSVHLYAIWIKYSTVLLYSTELYIIDTAYILYTQISPGINPFTPSQQLDRSKSNRFARSTHADRLWRHRPTARFRHSRCILHNHHNYSRIGRNMRLWTLACRSRFGRFFPCLVPSLRVYIVLNIYIVQFSYVYSVWKQL